MIGFRLPYIPGLPLWGYVIGIMVIIAIPIAYFAKRKGYRFWVFLLAGALLHPLACLVILVSLPRIVGYVDKSEEGLLGSSEENSL